MGGPLGKLMNVKGIGIGTIETLFASGIRDIADLTEKPPEFWNTLGLGKVQTESSVIPTR